MILALSPGSIIFGVVSWSAAVAVWVAVARHRRRCGALDWGSCARPSGHEGAHCPHPESAVHRFAGEDQRRWPEGRLDKRWREYAFCVRCTKYWRGSDMLRERPAPWRPAA